MKTLLTYLLGAALVGSVLANCATHHRLQAERQAHATSKAQHAELAAAAERLRAQTEAARRTAEQELNHAQEIHGKAVAALHLDLDRARDRARAAAVGLQNAARDAAQRARAQCASPAPADLGTPAGDPIGVLGRVLAEVDDYAGVVAEFADRSRIAGRACEREYETLRETLKAN